MSETYEKIYAVIRKIPRGKVATYGQIARLAGLGPHARMVGYALHALRNGTNLPWFRVVGAGGKLSLPGEGGRFQAELLESEGVKLGENGKIPMKLFNWRRAIVAALPKNKRPTKRSSIKKNNSRG